MDRRTFLKELFAFSATFAVPNLSFAEESNKEKIYKYIDSIIKNWWDPKTQKLKAKLPPKHFEYVRYISLYVNDYILENKRTQKEKDILYIYNRIKYPYLYEYIYSRIKRDLRLFSIDSELIVKKIRNLETSFDGNHINFANINENLTQAMLRLCSNYSIDHKIPFSLSLIENNFGKTQTSIANARGIMQTKPIAINFVENYFNLEPKYKHLKNKKDKIWRELIAGILYIKAIKELLEIKNEISLDIINTIIVSMCYKEGIDKIMENLEGKPFDDDAIIYARECLSCLSYEFKYEKDEEA